MRSGQQIAILMDFCNFIPNFETNLLPKIKLLYNDFPSWKLETSRKDFSANSQPTDRCRPRDQPEGLLTRRGCAVLAWPATAGLRYVQSTMGCRD